MKKIIIGLKNLDKDTYKIMKYGLIFCTVLALIASGILLTYIFLGINTFYYFGILLTKSSIIFAVEFIVCGVVVDFLRKHPAF